MAVFFRGETSEYWHTHSSTASREKPLTGSRFMFDGRNANSFTKFGCTTLRGKLGYESINRKSAVLSEGGKVFLCLKTMYFGRRFWLGTIEVKKCFSFNFWLAQGH